MLKGPFAGRGEAGSRALEGALQTPGEITSWDASSEGMSSRSGLFGVRARAPNNNAEQPVRGRAG